MTTLVDAINKFAFDLHKKIDGTSGNIFFSPMSIAAALGMVFLGARGDTAKQMEKVLHFNEVTGSGSSPGSAEKDTQCDRPGGPHIQFKALLAAINHHDKNFELSIANRLYGEEKYTFLQQFLHCTKEMYHAELQKVDFETKTEEARNQINTWVEKQTNGKITDLMASGSIDTTTILVLANAIYFKGNWKSQFDKKLTKEAPFWINENQSKNVPMMNKEGEFNVAYIQNPSLQILELPYDKNEMSMFILLPDKKGGAHQVEKELTYAKFQEWTSSKNMQKQKVDIYVPKFKLEETYELNKLLVALGMTDVFTRGKADLSGMSGSKNLFVSKAIHKSYVVVNEEGTEAAAATGVGVSTTSMPVQIRADHPFIFLIRNNKTQSILFLGRYNSP
ncbi:Hypothetical predicted protein [Podarcis lilfordi]|uniref:Serpin domain-containing protein n=1 Tax=Podarcis lilfordi TaxID=74358 RepID=A0AA35PCC3_9SAUR|nr:Hypothetical predicted protein [Podarcis lilfordi]